MDKEKFVERVMNMVYHLCGCTDEEALEVLEECIKRVKGRMV